MSLAAFLDEEELNEHEAAWRSKDWDKIEELRNHTPKTRKTPCLWWLKN